MKRAHISVEPVSRLPERLLTTREVAAILQVSPSTVQQLVASGRLTAIQVGRRLRFTRAQLEVYLAQASGVHRAI